MRTEIQNLLKVSSGSGELSSSTTSATPSMSTSTLSPLPSSKYRVNEIKEDYESSILSVFSLSLCDQNNSVICETGLKVTFLKKYALYIETVMEEKELAPLFDGEVWAGSMIWHAALHAVDYIYEQKIYEHININRKNRRKQENDNSEDDDIDLSINLIELGCGTGIPGLLCSLMGFNVCLTEQPNLIPLLIKNVNKNLDVLQTQKQQQQQQQRVQKQQQHQDKEQRNKQSKGEVVTHENAIDMKEELSNIDNQISIKELIWDEETAERLVEERKTNSDHMADKSNGTFDVILCCDCVYEPLYGTSYLEMLRCISILGDHETLVYISVERRDKDGIQNFLKEASALGRVECVAQKNDILLIYQIHLTRK